MDVHPGDVVAIQGVGGLGHLGIQFANKMGYKTVAVSRGPEKKDFATKLGAHVYIDSNAEDPAEALQKLGGAKVIAAVAPSGKAMEQLIGGLAVNGQLLTLAVADKLEVPIMTLIQKRASVRGWPSGSAADSEDTVKFAQTSGVECMVEEYPLDKVNEAFNAMMEGKARCVCVSSRSCKHDGLTRFDPQVPFRPRLQVDARHRAPSSPSFSLPQSTNSKIAVHSTSSRRESWRAEKARTPCFCRERLQQTICGQSGARGESSMRASEGGRAALLCLVLENLVGDADEVGFFVCARLVGELVFSQGRVVPLDWLQGARSASCKRKGERQTGRTDFFRS